MYGDEIIIRLNDASFAYDVHSLYQAFYPRTRISVLTEEAQDADFSCDWEIVVKEEEIRLAAREVGREEDGTKSESGAGQTEDGTETTSEIVRPISAKSVSIASLPRAEVKNRLKLLIYDALAEHTGRRLPWGTLTGIRPTKLALTRRLAGESDEEIAAFMRETYRTSEEKIALCTQIAGREAEILHSIEAITPLREQTPSPAQTLSAETVSSAQTLSEETVSPAQTLSAESQKSPRLRSTTNLLSDGYSLYLGIPFCPSICLYCSFSAYAIGAYGGLVEAYLDALFREIDATAAMFSHRPLTTVYIGGGTPTSLSASQLERLLDRIERAFDMSHVLEFTVEAGRPDSLDKEKLAVLAAHFGGRIRISINPQTFQDKTLALIGRRHTTEDILRCYEQAREAGFNHINMDLIMGLPGETVEDIAETLAETVLLGPDNLTVHSLAIKRSSRLHELLAEGRLGRPAPVAAKTENTVTPAESTAKGPADTPTESTAPGSAVTPTVNIGTAPVGTPTKNTEPAPAGMQDGFSLYRDYLASHGDAIMRMAHASAADMGMQPYYLYRQKNIAGNLENVGFAPAGKEGLYNIIIMEEQQDIVALGAGAACKCLVRDEDGIPLPKAKIRRCENVKNPEEYIQRIDEMIERKRQLYSRGQI